MTDKEVERELGPAPVEAEPSDGAAVDVETASEPYRGAPVVPKALVALANRGPVVPAITTDTTAALAAHHAAADANGYIHAATAFGLITGGIGLIVGAEHGDVGVKVLSAFCLAIGVIPAAAWRLLATDRRRAREAAMAAECPAQPYPIDGYVAWRLARSPAIDVRLRGPIDHAVVGDAARALDPAIEIAWPAERVLRIVIPARPALLRRVLGELVQPIAQDVGVERIVMGDAPPAPETR